MTHNRIDNCAVCLYFDAETEATIRCVWDKIAKAGISSEMPEVNWRPHLTLSGCHDMVLDSYLPVLAQFAAQNEPMAVSLTSAGCFGFKGTVGTSPCFLAPTVTQSLLDLHERHHRLVSPHCTTVSPYYSPSHWTPHCTLALNLSAQQIGQVFALLSEFKLPLVGRLEAVSVVRVARPFVQELAQFPFGQTVSA